MSDGEGEGLGAPWEMKSSIVRDSVGDVEGVKGGTTGLAAVGSGTWHAGMRTWSFLRRVKFENAVVKESC